MAIARGERFYLDLDSDDDESTTRGQKASTTTAFNFLGDVKERIPSAPKPPTAPTPRKTISGFPEHKKRTRLSAFKQQRQGHTPSPTDFLPSSKTQTLPPQSLRYAEEDEAPEAREKREIDMENKQKLAEMSPAEIERERQELFAGLNSSLIERLLKRANLDETRGDNDPASPPSPAEKFHNETENDELSHSPTVRSSNSKSSKTVSFATEHEGRKEIEEAKELEELKEEEQEAAGPNSPTNDQKSVQETVDIPPPSSIHFPRPPQPPDLDPDDPAFLENLHEKYFPNLEYDPKSVSWMTPVDSSAPSSYSLGQKSLAISSLRFSFKGALIPPTKAHEIPVTEGLHHHGHAPEAAGYTIPELAILARSAVAAQRCMAFQTLGRILYRLGKGEFGEEGGQKRYNVTAVDAEGGQIREEIDEADDDRANLAKGLWDCMEEQKVVEILSEEANKEKGHMSAISYAQEALWNWRRGGGRKRKAV